MHEPTISFYEANARRFFDETCEVDMGSLYGPFLALLPTDAHIMDAGCGSGRDALAFLERGYEVTAVDASEAMVKLASQHIGRPVLNLSLDRIEVENCFDGVWACASLLHISRTAMPNVLNRIGRSLKLGGVLYASFRYGDDETVREGRLFSDYCEDTLQDMLQGQPNLQPISLWRTIDLRPNRDNIVWLNALLRKTVG